MVARNLKAGKFAEGIINYTFEGKLENHTDKQAEVLRYSDDLLVPFGPQDKEGIGELISQFNERTSNYLKENPDNKNPLIGHQILSFTKEDETKLKKEGIEKVLDDYVKLAQLEKTQFIAVAHKDTANYHVHIIYHKVRNDMKKENDWKLNNKTIERGVALALKNRLTLVKDQKKIALTKGVLEIRGKDTDIQKLKSELPELRQARNMHHLTKLLEARKMTPEYLNDDRVKIDKKLYRPEDLNAIFHANREDKNRGLEESKGKNRVVREAKKPDPGKGFSAVTVQADEDRGPQATSKNPFTPVTIHSSESELNAIRRKRKGKHHLLKNKPIKQLSQSKGQQL
ncbi:relaxase/mobilization nuclease domain-containing protein [Larkinella sp. GY13]|uniref:relaxase/mobilization nuclease domain-containing protein n=1 Tax=Larkinella sp. GY13 TaxID=3453720 RepID=UPI003EE9AE94